MPKISILMGVFNCASTVEKSIKSIINQTYTDWEFIICDDGSIDTTLDIIKNIAKSETRIVLLENGTNYGLCYTLNKCLSVAKGEFCARMDGDDICDPIRLFKQLQFLENNPQYAFVSCNMIRFNENGMFSIKCERTIETPQKRDFLKGTPFSHAPVMIRKNAYEAVNGYRDLSQTRGVEDYDLWFRLYSKGFKGFNLSEKLYSMYDGQEANRRRTWLRRRNESWVRLNGYKLIKIPMIYWVYALKPLVLGMIPHGLYSKLRKKKW